MKKEILDAPLIKDSFEDFLEKNETIIWKGDANDPAYAITPRKRNSFSVDKWDLIKLGVAILGIVILIIIYFVNKGFFMIAFIVIAALNGLLYNRKNLNSKIIEYAITSKQIIIHSNYSKNNTFYNIPFTEIKNCIVTINEKEKRGTIFLVLKEPDRVEFETYWVKDNGEIEKRHQPTIENISNPHEVGDLIREGIKNVKA